MKVRYPKGTPLLPVEVPVIGKQYHVAWAKNGCIWHLIEINGDDCKLRTPVTKKVVNAKVSDLRHTRQTQHKIISKTGNYKKHIKSETQNA